MKLLGISSKGIAALAALMTAVALVGCPPELQGTLTVEIQPPEVRDEARWIVDGEEYESGDEVELPAGEQTVVLETRDGTRVRVPVDVEVDEHLEYHIELDGDDAEVARVE